MSVSNNSLESFTNAKLVLGYIAVKDIKTTEEKIEILDRLGYANKDITIICGTTPGVVKTIKYNIKKNKRSK